jgi:hypothetical protein
VSDGGCQHPESEVDILEVLEMHAVYWCTLCGSVRVGGGAWRAPTGIVLPGWRCAHCRGFNGSAKELLTECRCCGTRRKS